MSKNHLRIKVKNDKHIKRHRIGQKVILYTKYNERISRSWSNQRIGKSSHLINNQKKTNISIIPKKSRNIKKRNINNEKIRILNEKAILKGL